MNFRILKGDDGLEFVEHAEGPTKTRQAGLNAKSLSNQNRQRSFQPKMFQTGDERCPIALFREFVSRRPLTMQQNSPF